MMIHLGKTEIFERKMPQAIDCLIGSELAFADLLEKLADGFSVQAVLSSQKSAIGIQPAEV